MTPSPKATCDGVFCGDRNLLITDLNVPLCEADWARTE